MRALSLAMVAFVSCASVSASFAADAPLLPARVQQAIQDRIATGEYPALVIAVVDGKQSHIYGFGKLADGKAPDADTVFEVGSITKTFTALLLADALQSGAVQSDEPVSQALPGFTVPSRDGKEITFGNLATDYSGLPRLPTNFAPADMNNPYADYDAAKLKAFLGSYSLPRDPGTSYEYSNLGFGLIGYALAHQAHTSYGDLLQHKVLGPLHMSMSGTSLSSGMRVHLAAGHDEQGKATENWTWDALAGAGAVLSTGDDMLRYLQANMGTVKTPLASAMELAHKPRAIMAGSEQIGLAWMTHHDPAGDVIWHNGMTGGYASFVGFSSDGSHGVVVLTDIQQAVDDIGMATLLADVTMAPAQKTIAMTAQQLDAYAGAYQLAPNFILTIFRQDDQLLAQATGQGAFPIFPSASDEFFAKVAPISMSFKRDAAGKVTGLILHQNGDHPAQRMTVASAAASSSH